MTSLDVALKERVGPEIKFRPLGSRRRRTDNVGVSQPPRAGWRTHALESTEPTQWTGPDPEPSHRPHLPTTCLVATGTRSLLGDRCFGVPQQVKSGCRPEQREPRDWALWASLVIQGWKRPRGWRGEMRGQGPEQRHANLGRGQSKMESLIPKLAQNSELDPAPAADVEERAKSGTRTGGS